MRKLYTNVSLDPSSAFMVTYNNVQTQACANDEDTVTIGTTEYVRLTDENGHNVSDGEGNQLLLNDGIIYKVVSGVPESTNVQVTDVVTPEIQPINFSYQKVSSTMSVSELEEIYINPLNDYITEPQAMNEEQLIWFAGVGPEHTTVGLTSDDLCNGGSHDFTFLIRAKGGTFDGATASANFVSLEDYYPSMSDQEISDADKSFRVQFYCEVRSDEDNQVIEYDPTGRSDDVQNGINKVLFVGENLSETCGLIRCKYIEDKNLYVFRDDFLGSMYWMPTHEHYTPQE